VNAISPGMREEWRSHQQLAALAQRQHGVVSSRQLQRLGYSKSAIGRASKAGHLHRVHQGAYAVGHTSLTEHGRCIAAVASCGPTALLSHTSAAWLWGLAPECPARIHVAVPKRGRNRADFHLHHAPALNDSDRALREGIPVTALPRTFLDVAATAPRRLDRMIERAERLELFDLREVDSLLARTVGHPGAGRLRKAIAAYRDPAFTRSRLEQRFLALVREAGLPRPDVNTFVAGFELDMYWPAERFAVELDGYETHGTRAAFESDRIRQEDLKLAEIEMIRITDRRLKREPEVVAKRLETHLERRRREMRSSIA